MIPLAGRKISVAWRTTRFSILGERREGRYGFSTGNLITDMVEVREANRYFEEKLINQAIQHFERSLTILPFYMKDNAAYNEEFGNVVNTLARSYAWKGQTGKVVQLASKVVDESSKMGIQLSENSKYVCDILSVIAKSKGSLYNNRYRQIKDSYVQIAQREIDIPRYLVTHRKSEEANSIDLQPYIHSELRSSTAFVFTSLLAHPSFPTNPQYNKLCNTLLKGAQKSSQKNIVKPLTLLITNLLRNKQYMQAEGMIQYCFDRKRQNVKLNLLKQNQQFILLNLLLSHTYEGVDRVDESKRIHQQYFKLFNFQTFLLQHFLIDSI